MLSSHQITSACCASSPGSVSQQTVPTCSRLTAVAEKPDAIVVSIPDADALKQPIMDAKAAGIPVGVIDSGQDQVHDWGLDLWVGGGSEYDNGVKAGEIEEQELLRKAEILLQQPVSVKTAIGIRQDAIVAAEPDFRDGFFRQDKLPALPASRPAPQNYAAGAVKEQFIKQEGCLRFAPQKKAQPVQRQIGKSKSTHNPDFNSDYERNAARLKPEAGR